MRRLCASLGCVLLLWSVALGAVQLALDRRAIEEAIAIGQSRIVVERSRFHTPYILPVSRAPVDAIHIVTPFRRLVLAAEQRARAGERSFGQKEALELLAGAADEIILYVELTFHPLNTYIGVPAIDVAIVEPRSGQRHTVRRIDRLPRYGPRVESAPLPLDSTTVPLPPAGSQPLLGGTVIARFDVRMLDPNGTYDVVVGEGGKEQARARLDFGKLR